VVVAQPPADGVEVDAAQGSSLKLSAAGAENPLLAPAARCARVTFAVALRLLYLLLPFFSLSLVATRGCRAWI